MCVCMCVLIIQISCMIKWSSFCSKRNRKSKGNDDPFLFQSFLFFFLLPMAIMFNHQSIFRSSVCVYMCGNLKVNLDEKKIQINKELFEERRKSFFFLMIMTFFFKSFRFVFVFFLLIHNNNNNKKRKREHYCFVCVSHTHTYWSVYCGLFQSHPQR